RPLIEKFNGRWLKEIGDGVLASFNAVSEAVYCAKAIQKACENEPDLKLRIGIHEGEVIFEGDDVFGDGVNIASRLEPLAPIRGILVSESVHKNVLNKKGITTTLVGEKELRGVREPVRIYEVLVEVAEALVGESAPSLPPDTIERKSTSKRKPLGKSIAVLPFRNDSEERGTEYFANGVMEAILNHLCKIHDLRVISRNSMEQYRETTKSTPTIAAEIGVAYILEGSVQKYGNQVRITTQLIQANPEQHLWSENYDREMEDIFVLQTDIAKKVAGELEATLSPQELERIEKTPTQNLAAYDKYQKGQELIRRGETEEEFDEAEILFQEAIELDPNFSLAYVGLADVYLTYADWGRSSPNETIPKAMQAALKAQGIDGEIGECYGALGAIYFYLIDLETSEKYLKKAINLSPNFVLSYYWLSVLNLLNGNIDQSIEFIKKAQELDPLSESYKNMIPSVYYYLRRYDRAVEEFEKFLVTHPDSNLALWYLATTYTAQGRYQKAIDTFHKRTAATNTNWALGYAYGLSGNRKEALRILNSQLEKKEKQYVPSFMISAIHLGLGEKEIALDWLERGYNTEGANPMFLIEMKIGSLFDPLRDEPRFKDLLNKLGF
ncbi:MAG: tetratricopeptide repeat protein, partial [Thermodesulfobacteriota bacterium]